MKKSSNATCSTTVLEKKQINKVHLVQQEIQQLDISKSREYKNTIDNTYIEYYCVGRFQHLNVYFKNMKLTDIEYSDMLHLLKCIPVAHIVSLRCFIRHMKKEYSQLVQGTAFDSEYRVCDMK